MGVSGMDVTLNDVVVHQPIDHIGTFPVSCADHQGVPQEVALINLNSAVGAKQNSSKLLILNQCLCLKSSTMTNPFGEAL